MSSPPGPLTIKQLHYDDAAFDPAKFVLITVLAQVPNVLIVRNSLAVASVADVVALTKAHPGKPTYASQGVGSTAFLTAKLFEPEPMSGWRACTLSRRVVAGHVDMMCDTSHVRAIVAATTAHRVRGPNAIRAPAATPAAGQNTASHRESGAKGLVLPTT